jgi:hypothetical protein
LIRKERVVMKKSQLLGRAAVAACLAGSAAFAVAQDSGESQCAVPGLTLLTDAAGDSRVIVVPDPTGTLDLLSLQVAQPPQEDGVPRLVFTLKASDLSVLPPQSAWFASFLVGNSPIGVRMQTDNQGNESFFSYAVAASTTGDTSGVLVDASRPAEPSSNYTPDGTITIVVRAQADVLRSPGNKITGFNAGTVLTAGDPNVGSVAFTTDGMPNDLSRSGEFTLSENVPCAAAAKSDLGQFGGALSLALLPLLAFAGRRRS